MKKFLLRIRTAIIQLIQEAVTPVIRKEVENRMPRIRTETVILKDSDLLCCSFAVHDRNDDSYRAGIEYEQRLREAREKLFEEVMKRVTIDANPLIGYDSFRRREVYLSIYVKKP